MSASTPSQTVFSIGYDFHAGNGTAGSGTDNGNVYGIYNYRDRNRDQAFTYDRLNRLLTAQNAGTDCTKTTLNPHQTEYWGNSYSYDAWGNLLGKTVTKCGAENFSVTADGHNWIHAAAPDYQYDAAGNMIHDATSTLNYNFDQENRLTGAAGYTYTYDGDGNRVIKANGTTASSGTLYWYMTPGVVAESDLAGTLKSEYIFFAGERVARKDFPGNTVAYYFSDHLKTASVITNASGAITADSDYYPWGGELQFLNNDSNDYKFTGKKRDAETGLDYFGARYYSNGLSRWISADWSSTPVPVPYADFSDPQSLNLYQFVGGNPGSKADPDGHFQNTATAPATATPSTAPHPTPSEVQKTLQSIERGAGAADAAEAGEVAVTGAEAGGVSFFGSFFGVVGLVLGFPQKTGGPDIDMLHNTGNQDGNQGQTQENEQVPEPAPASGGTMKGDGKVPPSERDPKRFFNRSEKQELKSRAGGKCETCGIKTIKAQASRAGTKHSRREGQAGHKKAWSKGGKTEVANGKHQCRGCNQSEGANSK